MNDSIIKKITRNKKFLETVNIIEKSVAFSLNTGYNKIIATEVLKNRNYFGYDR